MDGIVKRVAVADVLLGVPGVAGVPRRRREPEPTGREGAMGLVEDVARRRELTVRETGGLALVSAADAEEFLAGCRQARIVVLGIEGFRFQGEAVVPDMDAIADFAMSKVPSLAASIEGARRFVRTAVRPGMWLDFTLQEESASIG